MTTPEKISELLDAGFTPEDLIRAGASYEDIRKALEEKD